MTIFILDGSLMIDKESTYKHISHTMHFPGYFGNNLDALADMLSYYDKDTIIILTKCDQMLESLGEYGQSMIETFEEGSEENGFTFIKK